MKIIDFKPDDIIKKARIIKIFKHLSDDELKLLLDCFQLIEYKRDEQVLKEGEVGYHLFAIYNGSVRVVVRQEHEGIEKDVYICTLGQGEIIGEAAIFVNAKRTADIVANEDAVLLRIEREKFLSYIKKIPVAGIKMFMIIIYSLLSKLKEVNHELAFERKAVMDQGDIDNLIDDIFNN